MSVIKQVSSIVVQRTPYDQGHIDGKRAMVSKVHPAVATLVGIDDYSKGFRAGYFNRAAAPIPLKQAI
jgi:hypothetical protein